MKKNKIITPILGELLKKIAPKIGAEVIIEPRWGFVGQIIFANGRKRYFRYSSLDLNTLGASEIAKDKDYANFFMKRMAYPTIKGKAFFSPRWSKAIGSKKGLEAAYHYAVKIGFPVVVKPNSGSQGKSFHKVYNKREFYKSLRSVFSEDKVALVQKFIRGNDYRIVVLDDKVISAYQRVPFNIIGDGISRVENLIKKKLRAFIILDRPAKIAIDDWRVSQNLKRQGLHLKSVLPLGKKIFLLDNANLSSGGDSLDVTKTVHPKFKEIAVKLTRDMGLRLCGVDLMVDGEINMPPKKYWIIEINSAPGLDHYIKTGAEQEKIVEDLYLQVLKALGDNFYG
ncbi:MAG: cyanophycin synthetase [Patescibacteria group bacterium]